MISLQERLTTILSLASQLRELDQLQERVRKAEFVRRSRGSEEKERTLSKKVGGPPCYYMRPWPPGTKRAAGLADFGV